MGGGAMRAAAKVAGITLANGSLRGITSEKHPLLSHARRASTASSTADEDWVFAGEDDEDQIIPRFVFGGAPSLQEAKDATSELSVALQKTYLSPSASFEHEGSFVTANDSFLSTSSSQTIVNKAVTSERAVAPAVPVHAVKAFKFLNESSVAQNVVASIACDPNVWNAVLQNEELQVFLQSQKTSAIDSDEDSDIIDQSSPKNIVASFDYTEFLPDIGYSEVVQKVKVTVVDIMSNLSGYFQNFFGDQAINSITTNSDGTARVTSDTVMEASFMGLAVMAIMVIVLKRGE